MSDTAQDNTLRLYAFIYNNDNIPQWTELTSETNGCIAYDSVIAEGGVNRTVVAIYSGTIEAELLSGNGQLFFGKTKSVEKGEVLDCTAEILTGTNYIAEERCAVNIYPSESGEIRIAFRPGGEEQILTLVQQERKGLSEEQLRPSAAVRIEHQKSIRH